MTYTQKWTIVCMLIPQNVGNVFTSETWPLHVTLADIFAIDWQDGKVVQKLHEAINKFKPVVLEVGDLANLGTAKVMMLQSSSELQDLHNAIIGALTDYGAIFNNPEFTLDGFVSHCTIQPNAQLLTGQQITIDNLTIIDMFHMGNPSYRRVSKILPLHPKATV